MKDTEYLVLVKTIYTIPSSKGPTVPAGVGIEPSSTK